MRTLILLSCAVVGCLAFPDLSDLKRRLSSPDTSEAIADTVRIMHGMEKRQDTRESDPVQAAFDTTDANGDGHITADEFANSYVSKMQGHGLDYSQWIHSFGLTVPTVDTNGNGTLEVDGAPDGLEVPAALMASVLFLLLQTRISCKLRK